MSVRSRLFVVAAAVCAAFFVVPAAPAPAAAQLGAWEINSFAAEIDIREDGSLQVTETFEVTFNMPSRGIYREIPFRIPADDSNVRRYRFDEVRVATSEGTPDDLHQERDGDFEIWRVGDPDTYLTGDHQYTLSYRVRGALNSFDDHDELFWNATGDRWDVPIEVARVRVTAPQISDVHCFAGVTGQTDPCASADHDGQTATFGSGVLEPGEQLDVVVAIPPGLVEVPAPELEPASPLARVFRVAPLAVGGGSVLALLGAVAVIGLARRGRDAPAAPMHGVLPGGVEYRPPEELRPGQLRALLTESVDDKCLSATLVDLAVRGHLRIEEVERSGLAKLGRPDWVIHRQPQPPAEPIQPFEQEMLDGLFKGGRTSVKVSDLRNGKFHKYAQRIKQKLYQDLVARGFYKRDPSHVKAGYTALGVLVMVAGAGAIAGAFILELPLGLLVAPLPVIGLLLVIFAQKAPRRTPQGAAMYKRAQGFQEFVRTAEADRMEFAERERIFAGYLPYAMVFDCVDQWVRAFERLGVAPTSATQGWYVGHGAFDVNRVTSSVSSLTTHVGGSMRHTASSGGSSGFSGSSGGGGGGGGGGRW